MPSLTPRGYPYPLPTEPVAEGAQAIRNLADRIDSNSAWELIQSLTLTGAAPYPTFSAIPQIYRDLQIRIIAKAVVAGSGGTIDLGFQFNDSAAANTYYTQRLWAFATTPTAAGTGGQTYGICGSHPDSTQAAHILGSSIIDLPNYRSTAHKTWLYHNMAWTPSGPITLSGGGYWLNTAAITKWQAFYIGGGFAIGSAALYGLK